MQKHLKQKIIYYEQLYLICSFILSSTNLFINLFIYKLFIYSFIFHGFQFYGFSGISAFLRGSFLTTENKSNSLLLNGSLSLINGYNSKNFNVKSSYHNNIINEKNIRESITRQSSDKKVFFGKKHSSEKLSIALEKLMINNEKRKRILDKLEREKTDLILNEKKNMNCNIMKNSIIINKAKNAFKLKIKQKNDRKSGDKNFNDDHNYENDDDHNNENFDNSRNIGNIKNNSQIDNNKKDEYNSKKSEISSKLCDIYPSWTDHVNRRNPLSSTQQAKIERLEYLNHLKNHQIQLNGISENKIKNILTLRLPKQKTENQISSK